MIKEHPIHFTCQYQCTKAVHFSKIGNALLLSYCLLLTVLHDINSGGICSPIHSRPCLTMICWCSVAGSSILQNKNWNNFKSLWRRYNRCVHVYRDALVSINNYYIHWNPGPNSVVQYVFNDIRVLFRDLPVFILPRLTTKINLHIFSTTTTRFWKWKFPQNDFVKARAFCQV